MASCSQKQLKKKLVFEVSERRRKKGLLAADLSEVGGFDTLSANVDEKIGAYLYML